MYKIFFHPLDAFLPFEAFKRHAYIVGGSGSGKSELIKLIIHKQINILKKGKNKSSAIVIDPHGDLVEEIARFKECKNNDDIIVFDPTLYKNKTPCINIFSPPDYSNETIDTLAQNLTNAFSEIVADTSISSQMKTLLIPCISVLLNRRDSDLGDLQRFMLSDHNEDLVELGIQSKNKGHADFFKYGFNEKNFDVTKKSIYTRLQTLRNSTAFRMMLRTHSTLNLERELNQGKIILFNLSKSALGDDVSSAYGRLIVALVKSMGFRRQQVAKSQRTPTFVYIDECQNYVGESIETTLTELRKYGIHMILANQVLGQNMSSQLVDIILSNTSVKFVGKNGSKTLKRMAVETKADIEELEKLTTANFYCKVNTNKPTQPFKFKAPSHLVGNRNSMSPEDWKRQKQEGWIGYLKNKEEGEKNQTEVLKFADEKPDFVPDTDTREKPITKTKTSEEVNNTPKYKL